MTIYGRYLLRCNVPGCAYTQVLADSDDDDDMLPTLKAMQDHLLQAHSVLTPDVYSHKSN